MKKLTLLFALLCSTLLVVGQEVDKKYLAGAITETNGKVVLNRSVKVSKNVSTERLFQLVENWAQQSYSNEDMPNRKVALVKPEDKYLACQAEDILVFRSGFLSQDQANMRYQLVVRVEEGAVNLEFKYIKYTYQDEKSILLAEEMITDKYALHKKGEKLNRYYDKFRTFTIDHVDAIRDELRASLELEPLVEKVKVIEKKPSIVDVSDEEVEFPTAAISRNNKLSPAQVPGPQAPAQTVATETVITGEALAGYKQLDPERLPGNILKMLKEDWSLVTSGKDDNINVMTASWGGIGRFWEKSISMSFLNPTRHSVSTMDDGDTYTITFYTEMYRDALSYCGNTSGKTTDKIKGCGLTPIKTPSGATAFAEAWLIIECRKMIAQPITEAAVNDKQTGQKWSKDGYHKIYIGEIVNIWGR